MLFYALTISLSAFLLFAVQPIVAKAILPWFGGSSAVWSTCMLFFQAVLLLGYAYAHWLHQKLAPRVQAAVHSTLLALSLATLPVLPSAAWKTVNTAQPSLRILALLAVTVGLPYFLLSSTSPLLQAWYARGHKDGLPYRLFALSNFFSMLALLSYPLFVEPQLSVHHQGVSWSWAFAGYALLCSLTAWRAASDPAAVHSNAAPEPAGEAPRWSVRLLWLGLAASASVLLLAVTNHLTQDVAAIPFLWILPLSVYLLSFIICFESPRMYQRALFLPLVAASLAFMAYRLWNGHARMPTRPLIGLLAFALFSCCMVCHGELARLKPHPRYLTGFYVTVSLGGAVGGIFVGLVAPNVFHAYYEFPIGLAFCAVVILLLFAREFRQWPLLARRVAIAAPFIALFWYAGFWCSHFWGGQSWPMPTPMGLLAFALLICCLLCHTELDRLRPSAGFLAAFYLPVVLLPGAAGIIMGVLSRDRNMVPAIYEVPAALVLAGTLLFLLHARGVIRSEGAVRYLALSAPLIVVACYVWFLGDIMHSMVNGYLVVTRNFYGQLRVYDTGDPEKDPDAARELVHGMVNHGEQSLRPEYRRQPITYFCPQSGIGRGMRAQEGTPRRIGILGLGCGTLAAYGKSGDMLRIYEINPDVLRIANRQFTYLADTPAKVEVALGDGRLSLDTEPSQKFDMLVMDAFSGDSVPVHLITREAFQIYFRHLKPNGILAVNITNMFLDLEPVIERAATDFGKVAFAYHIDPDPDEFDGLCFACSWTLILSPSTLNAHPELAVDAKRLRPHPQFREWTDDFSNMYSILK